MNGNESSREDETVVCDYCDRVLGPGDSWLRSNPWRQRRGVVLDICPMCCDQYVSHLVKDLVQGSALATPTDDRGGFGLEVISS
jgi:hypothetical protein